MTSLVEAPRIELAEVPEIPALHETPGFWECPRCPYRIALDFPNGIEEPIVAHTSAHTLLDLGIVREPVHGRARPEVPRRSGR